MKIPVPSFMIAAALMLSFPHSNISAAPLTVRPDWVATSNHHAQILLEAQGMSDPETLGSLGVSGYDDKVADIGPGSPERYREAMEQAQAQLLRALQVERNEQIRQDLEILIRATRENIEGSRLDEQYLLSWVDAGRHIFNGVGSLLSDQVPEERRNSALNRLNVYVGQAPGATPFVSLARQRYQEKLPDPRLLQPTRFEVEQSLSNLRTYIDAIEGLFARYKIAGAGPALAELKRQLSGYAEWTRSQVLPKARGDARLPPELYAFRLRQYGIDADPELLMRRARLEFAETRATMQQLAPLVAKAENLDVDNDDYRAVIRALKGRKIADNQLEAHYRSVNGQMESIVRSKGIADVPRRPLQIRLASVAESAASPGPHYLPPPMVGNTGQQGQFVLTPGIPASGEQLQYDDFNFEAVAWTLSAHEARPGHDLQFAAMVERGVSLARCLYAFNSVNVEGWALYAEAEMVPYEPLDGQFLALQFRLMRAARAFLDPMLNLGLIDRESAGQILARDVGLSPAKVAEELDRYTVRMPGQAGAYFYGYTRIMELRLRAELMLGTRFDRQEFNDFLLDQGLLPPDLLDEAVERHFFSAQKL